MMHGHEKSDPAIVATKPANKAEGPSAARPAEEKHAAGSVERRAGTKGNADQQSTHRTQRRHRVAQALECIRKVGSTHFAVTHPRWEPDAGKPHARSWAGGARGNRRPYRYNGASSLPHSAAWRRGRSRRARSSTSACIVSGFS